MTTPRPRAVRTARRTAAAALALASAAALAGCSATNQITTVDDYPPSDGVAITVDEVRALNLLVLAEEEGGPGILVGALANNSGEDTSVTLAVEGAEPVEVDVPSSGTVLMGAVGAPGRYRTVEVPVAEVAAIPGGLTTVTISTPAGGSDEVRVPVMDGSLAEYAPLLEAIGQTPTPSGTPTPSPTPGQTQEASEPEQGQDSDPEGEGAQGPEQTEGTGDEG
ncbi:hypothetical protein GC089_15570 [Cellulomonas sp. JZ18]|uniref:hypothetical protein n=1 Tax=Cellulomonas sp. JZ18 TaxID=2654191 RepID=UPI0012D459AC|nr:hypothetical protein [Cellulomonas sp. JZ18]QGQ20348.1 hypothetical protein GC089_15570 [Cellulomonas sp. JZ18]